MTENIATACFEENDESVNWEIKSEKNFKTFYQINF